MLMARKSFKLHKNFVLYSTEYFKQILHDITKKKKKKEKMDIVFSIDTIFLNVIMCA